MLSVRIINGADVCEITDSTAEKFGSDIYQVLDVVKRCLLGLGFHPEIIDTYTKGENNG